MVFWSYTSSLLRDPVGHPYGNVCTTRGDFSHARVRSVQWNLSYSRLCASRAIVYTHNIHTYVRGKTILIHYPDCRRWFVTALCLRSKWLLIFPVKIHYNWIRSRFYHLDAYCVHTNQTPVCVTLFALALELRLNYWELFEFFLHNKTALYF